MASEIRKRVRNVSSIAKTYPLQPEDLRLVRAYLQTLEARGLIVISRSPGGHAESVWLTPEGQKWASQLTGSCN